MGQHFSKLNESTLSAFGLNRRIETASGRIRFWFSGQNERRRPMATLCDVATSTFAICRSLAPPSKWLCVSVCQCARFLSVCVTRIEVMAPASNIFLTLSLQSTRSTFPSIISLFQSFLHFYNLIHLKY